MSKSEIDRAITRCLAVGLTSTAKIAENLTRWGVKGASQSTVKRRLREMRSGGAQPRPAAPRSPAVTGYVDRRDELLAKVRDAEVRTDEEFCAAAFALARHDNPELDASIIGEGSVVSGILASRCGDVLFGLRDPEVLADLVRVLTEEPGGRSRDDGQTEEEFAAECAEAGRAEHARAVRLAAKVLEIVTARGVAERWRKS